MKLKCLAIDDEPLALKQISAYINRTPNLELVDAVSSAMDAYKTLDTFKIDLVFCDINMPELNGMDFVKSLQNKPGIIFTTAYSQYAIEGYKVDAIDYLLKPIGYDSFLASVERAKKRLEVKSEIGEKLEQKGGYLFIKSEYKIVRINLNNIKYIEGQREYLRIYLTEGKPVMTLLSFTKIEDKLPKEKFMRIHRSYIVNLDEITMIERMRIVFDNDLRIPVSDQYKEEFQKYLDDNFIK